MDELGIRVVPTPWNKGKLVGQKAPLKLKEIWAIRVRLQIFCRTRELALFDLGIDSKLRACDLLMSMAPRFSSKVAPQNSPVWRVWAISRVGDRRLRSLAAGHDVSGSAEWDWWRRWA